MWQSRFARRDVEERMAKERWAEEGGLWRLYFFGVEPRATDRYSG